MMEIVGTNDGTNCSLVPPPPSLMWSSAELGSQEKAAKSLGLPLGQKENGGSCLQHFDSSENP